MLVCCCSMAGTDACKTCPVMLQYQSQFNEDTYRINYEYPTFPEWSIPFGISHRKFKCPTCGGEFDYWMNDKCPFCGLEKGKYGEKEYATE